MVQKKKIALILPSLQGGGMERVMSELAHFFAVEKNADVHFVLLSKQPKFYELPSSVKIYEPEFLIQQQHKVVYTFKILGFIRKTLHTIKPDAVLTFGEMYNSLVLAATRFTAHRVFISDRSKPDKDWGAFQHLLRKLLYPRSAGIICQTIFSKQMMQTRFSHQDIVVIGNPIKAVPASAVKRENIVLSVGRLIKSKRIDLLIKLFSQTNYNGWKLCIVGDGPERPFLEKIAADCGVSNDVVFAGNQKNIGQYYQRAKIFAFTSNSEGFPNALGEAMRSGLAPISYNFIAGASDLIQHNDNGFLLEMNDDVEYAAKLNELMSDEALIVKFGRRAIETTAKYDLTIIGEEYYSFLMS